MNTNTVKVLVIGAIAVGAVALAGYGFNAALGDAGDNGVQVKMGDVPISPSEPRKEKEQVPKNQEAMLGTKIEDENVSVMIHAVETNFVHDNPYTEPEPGNVWNVFDVEVCNKSQEPNDNYSNSLRFEIAMSDNTRAQVEFTGKEPSLHSGVLVPGECIRGWLTFELPQDAVMSTLIYGYRIDQYWSVETVTFRWTLAAE